MSVEQMAIALHHSRAKGTARLILIGIANHDGDGGAWPSVATLAKYAGITDRRNVQRALASLESLGEIRRLVSAGGDHSMADYMRPNLYRVLLRCPPGCDRSAQHRMPKDDPAPDLWKDPPAYSPPPGESAAPHASPAPPEPSPNQISKEPDVSTDTHAGRSVAPWAAPKARPRPPALQWITDRCPGDWQHGQHQLGRQSGKCLNCYETPHKIDRETGEIL